MGKGKHIIKSTSKYNYFGVSAAPYILFGGKKYVFADMSAADLDALMKTKCQFVSKEEISADPEKGSSKKG